MHFFIAAMGHLKAGPEKALFDLYRKRFLSPLTLQEIGIVKEQSPEKQPSMAELSLLKAIPLGATLFALDEKGHTITSQEFATLIEKEQIKGTKTLAFAIGGANGLSAAVLQQAAQRLAFGRITWPHLLMRALLMEQLYRAQQILSHHPYHRA